MNKRLLSSCFLGLIAGFALSTYGHTANGYITGPMVVLALGVAAVGAIASAILLLLGRRSITVWALAAFSVSMLCALTLLPLVWPYPAPRPPMPLDGVR
jgi:hypothetical protein